MRLTLIIITIFIYSCSSKQESKQSKNIESIIPETEDLPFYDSLFISKCEHDNLSNEFDISVYFERNMNTFEHHDSCVVNLKIFEKKSKKIIDSFLIASNFYYSQDIFKDCKTVLSYSTKFNIDKQVIDNYFGDIIVADLNFDKKDDIAVINNMGGNGGTFYSYFIQNSDNKFILDNYLTDSIVYFPSKINNRNKTLTTYVHAGACAFSEHIYKLDIKENKWTKKSHKLINVCED